MVIISKIAAQKRKGRYNVYIQDKYAFSISEETLIKFNVHKDMELSDQKRKEILQYDEISKAYSKALNFLSGRLRTKNEIIKKLQQLDISEDVIKETIDKLEKLNLINDEEYSLAYIRTCLKEGKKGPEKIKTYLIQKGVSKNIIEKSLTSFEENLFLNNGLNLANKKIQQLCKYPIKIQQTKLKNFLLTKGYGFNLVNEIIEQVHFVQDNEEQQTKLRKEIKKYLVKYRNYDKYEQILKLKQALYRKGYQIDDINRELDKLN